MKQAIPRILALLLLLTLLITIHPIPVSSGPSSWSGPDFTWCFTVFQSYWQGLVPDPYSFSSLQAVLREKFGVQTSIVMPVAYSPTADWVLRPLDWFAGIATPVIAWNCISIALLGIALLRPGILILRPLHLAVVALLISSASIRNLLLGQTGHFGAALLVLLLPPAKSQRAQLLQGFALAVLSIKPTYFMLGLLSCLLARNLMSILWALLISLGMAAGVSIQLPIHAWLDFAHNVAFFASAADPNLLSPGTARVFELSLVLRQLISSTLGAEIGWQIARGLFAVWIIGWSITALHFAFRRKDDRKCVTNLMQAGLIGSALLAFPYLGFYEELLTIPFILALADLKLGSRLTECALAATLVLPAFLGQSETALMVLVKLLAISSILYAAGWRLRGALKIPIDESLRCGRN